MSRRDETGPTGGSAGRARWVVLLLALAGQARSEDLVRVSGTGTATGLMQRLGAGFERANPGIRVQVLPNLGSSGAVQAVAKGALTFAISGRPLRDDERAMGLDFFELTRTPFVFAVGPRVDVSGITTDELVQIYRGERPAWPNGERIRLILRPATDADTLLLKGFSPQLAAAVDAAASRPGMLMGVTNQDCNELLERTAGAIAPTSLMQLRFEARPVSALAWNGVQPTVASMLAGSYPLAKSLYVVVPRTRGPALRRWLAFVASAQGRRMLEELGGAAVPLPAGEVP